MMRIILALAAVFVLAGCETMDYSSVTVSTGVSTYHPHSHIRYTLGYYDGHYYNGYRVYGTYGHRYYHAPRGYRHHRHYARPRHYTPPRRYAPPRHRHYDRRDHRREHRNEHKRKEHKRRDHRRDERRGRHRDK